VSTSDAADAVFFNCRTRQLTRAWPDGRVHASDGPVAIVVSGGKIVAVTDNDSARAWVGSRTQEYDVSGKTVTAGFFDSHNHLLKTGLGLRLPSLAEATSIADVLATVRASARALPDGEWIQVSPRWHESQLAEARMPTARELDTVTPHNPALLRRGGHNAVFNSQALGELGLSDDTEAPSGATLMREPDGTLVGYVIGAVYINSLVGRIPGPSADLRRSAVRDVGNLYARHGITSVIEPGLAPDDIALISEMDARDELPVRLHMMWRVGYSGEGVEDVLRAVRDGVVRPRRGDKSSIFGIKLSVDGGVETGFYRDPYARIDDPAFPVGKPMISGDGLRDICLAAAEAGWHVGVHCVGDAGIDMVLDAFEATNAVVSLADRRWSLIHMMYPRKDHWRRVRELGLTVTAQQPLLYALGSGFVNYLGPDRARDIEPIAAYLKECPLPVGGGSDSPVAPFDPLLGIRSSLSRQTELAGVLGPEWSVDLDTAIHMYTAGSAYCAFQEGQVGRLDVGMAADLVVLSDDIHKDADALAGAEVALTMVDGQVRYDEL
jgi:predicted amidohydrolase YtcJ